MGTVKPVEDQASPFDCGNWAREVMDFLSAKFTKQKRFEALTPVVALASHMLSHLLIASMTLYRLI